MTKNKKNTKKSNYVDTISGRTEKILDITQGHLDAAKEITRKYAGTTGISGRIAEDYAASTFNVDAVRRYSSARAQCTARILGLNHDASDINIIDKAKTVVKAQSKFHGSAAKNTYEISKPKFDGMQKLVPSDQLDEVKRLSARAAENGLGKVNGNNYADTARNVRSKLSYKNIEGKPLSHSEAVAHAQNPKIKIRQIQKQEGISATANAAAIGATLSAATSAFSNVSAVREGKIVSAHALWRETQLNSSNYLWREGKNRVKYLA